MTVFMFEESVNMRQMQLIRELAPHVRFGLTLLYRTGQRRQQRLLEIPFSSTNDAQMCDYVWKVNGEGVGLCIKNRGGTTLGTKMPQYSKAKQNLFLLRLILLKSLQASRLVARGPSGPNPL